MVNSHEEENITWGDIIDQDEEEDYREYSSFTYRGIRYRIYDTIYCFSDGAKETDIGKILRITEVRKVKKLKILWFFRPRDIQNFLKEYKPGWKELFLACGNGKGLFTRIPLEAVIGKCNVISTSKDPRNQVPTKSEFLQADYYFSWVFNVDTRTLSDQLPDKIGDAPVDQFLNRVRVKPKAEVEVPKRVKRERDIEGSRAIVYGLTAVDAKRPRSSYSTTYEKVILKDPNVKKEPSIKFEQLNPENQLTRKRERSEDYSEFFQKPKSEDEIAGMVNDSNVLKSKKPATEQNWFCELPWVKKIKVAQERGKLVTFINLDPSYTSCDVQKYHIMMYLHHVPSSVHLHIQLCMFVLSSTDLYGEALVIFNKAEEANTVISKLNEKCLVDGNGRPVVAFITNLVEPSKTSHFPGHYVLEYEKKKRASKVKAESTSHCAQDNTIECQMAVEWKLLHEKFYRWFKALHKDQAQEIERCLSKRKIHESSISAAASDEAYRRAEKIARVKERVLYLRDSESKESTEVKEEVKEEEANPEHSESKERPNVKLEFSEESS